VRSLPSLLLVSAAALLSPMETLACTCDETPASCLCGLRPVESGFGPVSHVLAVIQVETVDGDLVVFRFDEVFSDPYGFSVPGGSPLTDCAEACADLADCAVTVCNLDEEEALPALRDRCTRLCSETPERAAGFGNPAAFHSRPLCEPIVHAGRQQLPEAFPETCAPADVGENCQERLCQPADHCDARSARCSPGHADLCADVSCGAGEVCEPATGGCRLPNPECAEVCGVGQVCERGACQACDWCWSGDCDRTDGHCTSLNAAGRGAFRDTPEAMLVAGDRVLVLLRGSPNWGAQVRPGDGTLDVPFELVSPPVRNDGAAVQCGAGAPVGLATSFGELAAAIVELHCLAEMEALGIPNPSCDCEGIDLDATVAQDHAPESDMAMSPDTETPSASDSESSGCQTIGPGASVWAGLGVLAGLWMRRRRATVS